MQTNPPQVYAVNEKILVLHLGQWDNISDFLFNLKEEHLDHLAISELKVDSIERQEVESLIFGTNINDIYTLSDEHNLKWRCIHVGVNSKQSIEFATIELTEEDKQQVNGTICCSLLYAYTTLKNFTLNKNVNKLVDKIDEILLRNYNLKVVKITDSPIIPFFNNKLTLFKTIQNVMEKIVSEIDSGIKK